MIDWILEILKESGAVGNTAGSAGGGGSAGCQRAAARPTDRNERE